LGPLSRESSEVLLMRRPELRCYVVVHRAVGIPRSGLQGCRDVAVVVETETLPVAL
jgi:hypothetical protein